MQNARMEYEQKLKDVQSKEKEILKRQEEFEAAARAAGMGAEQTAVLLQ